MAGDFLLAHLISKDDHLMRNWSEGLASQPGTLADTAGTILALYQLYEIDFSPKYYKGMLMLFRAMQTDFASDGVFYDDAAKHVPHMILQPSNLQDNVTPIGNALACHVHWLLYQLETAPSHRESLTAMLRNLGDMMTEHPHSFGY